MNPQGLTFLLESLRTKAEYQVFDLPIQENRTTGDPIKLTLPLESSVLQLKLRPNLPSLHQNFAYLVTTNNSTRVIVDEFVETRECFYENEGNEVRAWMDMCDGLNGIILINSTVYLIKPLPLRYRQSNSTTPHLLVKSESVGSVRKPWVLAGRRKRQRRSFGLKKEVKVETAIFVDRDLYRHMLNNFPENTERNLYRFVLAMINAVQLLYNDDSLEFKVTFLLKRLEILHADPPKLQRSHDIDRYLSNFCAWQEKENLSWEKSPLHWDHALMLTGLDLYAIGKSGKLSNQVLGLAPVAGMCKPSSSCTVNEGLHFESVYVVAHEIGHNLGMRHDGPSADNDCDPNSHIMSPTLGSGKSTWSQCSNRYLSHFLQSPQAQCLFQTTDAQLDHTEGGTLPGERFDADLQCMLKYGKQSERSQTQNIEEICRDLRCTKERYTWTSHPALEGTKCGATKWCRLGRCVEKANVEMRGFSIDGKWTEWSSYSECASACLMGNTNSERGSTGITVASRSCSNPRPENGGRYCSGNSKKYQTCEAMQCSNIPPITIKEFAEQICRRAREFDKDIIGLGFQRNSSDAEESCTVWCYQYNGGAKSRGWIFPDGTKCHSNPQTSNPMFCVSGRCEEFQCSPKNETTFVATGNHCESKFTQVKTSDPGWTPVGPCRYNCITPASGLRVLKRGSEHNLQLCQSTNCNKKKTLFEYATSLCSKYKSRVNKLSGLGIQLTATLEDPDRPCHVACQDEKFSHRFYLVTGEDGWFPFGADCARGTSGKKAYCVSGKCLEFGKNNLPTVESELTFFNVRRRRSLDVQNKTVTATVDLLAVRKLIDALSKGETVFPEPPMVTIDFDNPIHISPQWESESGSSNFSIGVKAANITTCR
ncbi:hypothetical protein RUM43_005022 [Polyplax serrata]|uniref:Peptidase M12B domain-containing protein n=1 Tax=Polyplax serrata TaxID=468196 RepID=A0AAN8XQZ5_POLSC